MSRLSQTDLFERDLFGSAPRRVRPLRARQSANGYESAELELEQPQRRPDSQVAPGPAPATGAALVLKRTQVRLPTLGEVFEVAKVLDTVTDAPFTRATNAAGAPVDSQRKLADEQRAYLRRHRQIHPALNRAMQRGGRFNVLIWLYVNEETYDKGRDREAGPRVASREEEMVVDPRPRPEVQADHPEPNVIAYRQQVDAVVERAARELPEVTGVRVIGRVGAVPGLLVGATPSQVRGCRCGPKSRDYSSTNREGSTTSISR